jgi:transcriptional regulator with XRE-family HTH domain
VLAIVSKVHYIVSNMQDKTTDIGAFIKQHRETASLSLRKLADKSGISNPYLSQIERGLRRPSAQILKSIAGALSIRAESLYLKAGLLDESLSPNVVDAIESDEQLTQRQRQVLLELYLTMASTDLKGEDS